MLLIENLDVYYGDAIGLKNVSIEVKDHAVTSILGANGAGKSTLLKAISGHQRARSGRILLDGEDLTQLPRYQIAERGVATVPEGRRVFYNLTVEDNLLVGATARRARSGRAERLESIYEMFPRLRERRGQLAGTLSGGEQQMLAIGRAMMLDPEIILLDEPSLGLAPLVTELVFEKIREIAASGTTMLLVEQNAGLALDTADVGYVLEQGEVVLSGGPEELRSSKAVQDAYLGVGE